MPEHEALTRARRRPTFALTFDTELIWGSFHHTSPDQFEQQYPDVRGTMEDILRLLERYEVSATWAVVGHLYLRECQRDGNGIAHPELERPRQSWRAGDWYDADPCTDIERDPLWYGPDVLDLLQAARVPQEIGCHSFGHALFGDPALTREAAASDLATCAALAQERGLELRSMVFPRNSVGWLDVLKEQGFTAFRDEDPWTFADRHRLRRVAHLAEHLLGVGPPVTWPEESLPGLWNITGSTLLIHRTGLRRFVTRRARARRVRAGIKQAIRHGGVFHLWTHPFNLASERRFMLTVLEDALELVVEARDRGSLAVETMGQIAERLAGVKAATNGAAGAAQLPVEPASSSS